MTVGEIFLAVPAKDIRERERERQNVGFFLELTTERVCGIH